MARAIIPIPGVNDQLGTPDKPFAALYVTAIYGPNGEPVAFIPIDASAIQTGVLNADRIDRLHAAATVIELARTLGQIGTDAALGASDPAARINAGSTLLEGRTLRDVSVDPNKISNIPLTNVIRIGDSGTIETDKFLSDPGWKMSDTDFQVTLPGAVWKGILQGLINIANAFIVDASGNAKFGDTVGNPGRVHGMNNDGNEWWGAANYGDGPTQIDPFGNFYLSDSPDSYSSIDLGAIKAFCDIVQAVPGGGPYAAPVSVTLQPFTRGSLMYYTTDGSDPQASPDVGSTRYTAPFTINPAGGPVTLKAAAVKLGVWSVTRTWIFAASGGKCAVPTFFQRPGFYTANGGQKSISLQCGTAGATIKYSIDGSAPGITYVNPFLVGPGQVLVKIQGSKGGLADSDVVNGTYYIGTGGGGGGSPGGGHLL